MKQLLQKKAFPLPLKLKSPLGLSNKTSFCYFGVSYSFKNEAAKKSCDHLISGAYIYSIVCLLLIKERKRRWVLWSEIILRLKYFCGISSCTSLRILLFYFFNVRPRAWFFLEFDLHSILSARSWQFEIPDRCQRHRSDFLRQGR